MYRQIWEANVEEETGFWRRWLTEDQFLIHRQHRMTSFAPFSAELLPYLPTGRRIYSVLDVGSGPVSTIGVLLEDRIVHLYAVDALADDYNQILDELQLHDTIRPIRVDGEQLTRVFSPNYFDLIICNNALDHCYDPVEVLRQMIMVCRPNCVIWSFHVRNVGEIEGYAGLHQWNLDCRDGRLVVWNRTEKVDVMSAVPGIASIDIAPIDPTEFLPTPALKAVIRKHALG